MPETRPQTLLITGCSSGIGNGSRLLPFVARWLPIGLRDRLLDRLQG